jgi:site-specific recombinase XerD
MHDIDAFVDQQRHRQLKPATIKRRVAALKTWFDFLAEETGDLNWPNPVRFKRHAGKQPQRLPRDLSDETVERLWQAITSPRDRAWFALMLRAGLRVGEVTTLKLVDLLAAPGEGQPARLRVCGKGQKERVVLLTADAYAVVQTWLAARPPTPQPYIFLNERGGRLTANGLEWLLHGYGAQVGIAVTPHQLRHTFARQVTEAGMPITSLGKLLGHAQVSTTQLYTAGADPELAHAYRQAMAQLESTVLPTSGPPVTPVAEPAAPPRSPPSPLTPTPPPLPDWDAWETQLPSPLRQACLAFVQRRLPMWKPRRRRGQALRVLGELRRFIEWQQARAPFQDWSDLHLADLQAYQSTQAARGQAANTINVTLERVLALLHELAEQGHPIEGSVFRLRPLPRPDSLPRHLSENDARRLEASVRARLDSPAPLIRLENAAFFVLAHAGLRASECLDLQVQDIDLPQRRLVVRQGKGQRDRAVYLSETAGLALQAYLAQTPRSPTALAFMYPNGKPLTYAWLYEHLLALGQAADVPNVTPHRLRHTLATRLLNAGMDVTRIQKLLGHEHLDTTMIYARVRDTTVEADYRKAMHYIELGQMPLSNVPIPVANWPSPTETQRAPLVRKLALDNSV